jgi:hypothetical protein
MTTEEDDMNEHDTDTVLFFSRSVMKEGAELPASKLRDNELRALCAEVQEIVGQPQAPDMAPVVP